MKKSKKSKMYKARHNIYLSGREISDNKIIIKGNKLNLRWFDNAILVWSDEDERCLPKIFLEIIEKAIKGEKT